MTMTLYTETPKVKIGQTVAPTLMEGNDDAPLERFRQEPFQAWLAKRIRNVYPK